MVRPLGRGLLLACGLALLGAAPPEPTVLSGVVRDPVDDRPLAGAVVQVGEARARTNAEGAFRVRLTRRNPEYLATIFEAEGYVPYRTWTETGAETARTVYLFPDRPVQLYEHDDPVPAETLREQFDIVYRDPAWRDPRQQHGWLWRWQRQPQIWINSRVTEFVEGEGGGRLVATRKVPGKVRRYVREVIAASIGPLTGGFLEPGRIRFRRLRPGDEITSRDFYREGEINVFFTDAGYFQSGGGHLVAAHEIVDTPRGQHLTFDLDACRVDRSLTECLTIVSGGPVLDLESLIDALEDGRDYLVKHEFAHVLGMQHRMLGSHGTQQPTILCSIMGGPCDVYTEVVGHTTHVDRVLARLAYTRPAGNDRNDQDPHPGERMGVPEPGR